MALTDKLTAIANAIRSKTGGSDLLTLDEMPQEIQSIQTGGGGDASTEDYDDIVATDADNSPAITHYKQTNPNLNYIKNYGLYGCKRLESIDVPNIIQFGTYSFMYCSALKIVVAPKIEVVNTSAFQDSGLERLDCSPYRENEPIVFNSACFRRSNLETLIIRHATQVAKCGSSTVFGSTPIEDGTGDSYVPQTLIEDYKVATNWATYASQFRAIEDYPEICGDGGEA